MEHMTPEEMDQYFKSHVSIGLARMYDLLLVLISQNADRIAVESGEEPMGDQLVKGIQEMHRRGLYVFPPVERDEDVQD